ncbi:MAG: CHAT domain-containing protein [Pseudomonadota bacterium]
MRNHIKMLIGVVFLLFSFLISASGEDIQRSVQDADALFNRGEYQNALAIYLRLAGRLSNEPNRAPLLSEVVNNMAATQMALGDFQAFQHRFMQARDLKQQIDRQQSVRHTGRENLLINGGFEEGLIFPWGTGHYERTDGKFRFGVWWNSLHTKAFMKIDTAEKCEGESALRITNYSPAEPHIFTTLSQRISGLEPNTVYSVSFYAKAKELAPGAVSFTIDAAWVKRLATLPPGTYDWRNFSQTINIGHNDYIDFRIIHQNTGTVWLDDIVIRKTEVLEETDMIQKAAGLFDTARYDEALNLYLDLEKKYSENLGMLALIRHGMGRIYSMLGKYDQAFETLNWAFSNGSKRLSIIDLAQLYYLLGDYDTAESRFTTALALVKGDQGTESIVLNQLSRCYLAQGRFKDALDAQGRSYHILKHIEDKHGQAQSLNQLGVIYTAQKNYETARSRFMEALTLARKLDDKSLSSDILVHLAETAGLLNDAGAAGDYVTEAVRSKTAIGDSQGLVQALHVKARLEVSAGKLEQARLTYREAVSLIESLSTGAAGISRETKAAFVQQFSRIYREYAEVLLELYHQTKADEYQQKAFETAERARSRIFTEMMEDSRAMHTFVAMSRDSVFAGQLEKERLLTAQIHALTKQVGVAEMKGDGADIAAILKQLEAAKLASRAVREGLLKTYPRYADLKQPKSLSLKDVQMLLGPDEAALSYFVGTSRTCVWRVTRETARIVLIPIARDALVRQVEDYIRVFPGIAQALMTIDPVSGTRELRKVLDGYSPERAHALYQVLVGPVADDIRNKSVVYVAPDDLLYKLPFETLLTEAFRPSLETGAVIGQTLNLAPFWITSQDIAYLPSLSVLRSLRTLTKGDSGEQLPLIAFADPVFDSDTPSGTEKAENRNFVSRSLRLEKFRAGHALEKIRLSPLPDTREEALFAAKILGASPEKDVFLQEKATEFNVKHLPLKHYKNLLFATHGLLSGDFGPDTQPSLALSFVNDRENDGFLEMGEILGLDLNAKLVVLSACNTAGGSGEADRGEGFAGLTRSFMYAGARSLLVTQWSVESGSAKMLVQKVFTNMGQYSVGKALALAKRDMIRGGRAIEFSDRVSASLAHPFFWGPYILVGEMK